MYEDIYKDLSEEDYQRMLKMDVPKAVIVGEFEMTPEIEKEATDCLERFLKEEEVARRSKK